MNKTALKQWSGLLFTGGLASAFVGCAGAPAVDSAAPAELAVNRAIEAKAAEYAPLELRLANEKLEGARRAMNEQEYEEAGRLAESAGADARLAEAKARAEAARKQAQEIRVTIDTLRKETEEGELTR